VALELTAAIQFLAVLPQQVAAMVDHQTQHQTKMVQMVVLAVVEQVLALQVMAHLELEFLEKVLTEAMVQTQHQTLAQVAVEVQEH
jgi:hypothetical protein